MRFFSSRSDRASRGARWGAGLALALFLQACGTPPPLTPSTGGAVATSGAGSAATGSTAATPAPVPAPRPPLKIGLALGGGAARGFAHIGVIQVLEEAGIKPDFVVGTSAGSVVAALYASGKTGAQLQQVAETMEEAAITDWTLPIFSRGMLKGEALGRYVNNLVANRLIEDMRLPLGVVATDLQNGQGVLFQRGNTGTAVRASSAVPSVFQPVSIAGRDYVDGGLVSPVPVRFARQMGATYVVAVDISSPPEGNSANDSLQILLQTFAIMSKSINAWELKEAELVIKPALPGIKSADFGARRRSIEAGRVAMLQALPTLKAALATR
ncbi:patatin-like phospholipase family protein [Curvibacter sp. HBC61]|uniref:Patatin-like phospholipase family protein n=1 Tax=Curvibacter cyanobacteriorum TaxID=3026422 RepID=A0ABT5N616_9BURK|nr:patatin-like phospholipase family protein [Curvibacter sp. HBC61]MDD0841121.1 patatin-like phospholipase family protein [Curvibacter sp. HBC61]